MIRKTILLGLIALSVFSCSKDENEINHSPVADFDITDGIDKFYFKSSATDVDNDILSYKWISESDIISINNSKNEIAFIELPAIQEPVEISLKHTVFDGLSYNTISKDILLPKLTEIRQWGLGAQLQKEQSNNVDYNWYIDQMNTGAHSYVNCGPATVTMAIKWCNKQFTETAEDARNTYRSSGGWWYTDDIINYLNKYSVNNFVIGLNNIDSLVREIDKENIIIICLDMYYINESSSDEWHIDKFYNASEVGWGHFFVIKGYKIIDNQILFEVFDPYSFGDRYNDNSLKGKDRYYKSNEIDDATNNWWDYAIIVTKENFKSSKGLDPNKIRHKYGI